MRTLSNEQLEEILRSHRKWLNGENGVRADLCGADLRGADLRGENLREADLRRANLRGVDLLGAYLRGADLRRADLRGADLYGADLCWADLRGANLYGVDIYGADLSGAKIDMDEFNKICPLRCPETGAFIGWKKADGHIVKLEIPEDALRSSATTNKCRCSKAKVLAIEYLDGSAADICEVSSDYDFSFVYEVGKTVEVKNFDRDRKNECAPGIHFFCIRQEAVVYRP